MKMLTSYSQRVLILTVLTGVACVHAQPIRRAATPAAAVADHTQVTFKVASAQSDNMLPGVTVSIIARDGTEIELGHTDMLGALSVPKAILHEHQARVVLFSREHFFTGAMRVDDPRADFYAFDEKFIELAAFALI